MKDYVIITDATSDLPQDIVEKIKVEVLPFAFSVDNKNYLNYPDNREMDPKSFYKMMREGKSVKTSQINVATFQEHFKNHLDAGKDVLCIALSSGISGTYNSAVIAAKELNENYKDNKVIVIDSISASLGEGMLIYNAAKKKEDGLSIDELSSWVEENKKKLCHWFTVSDLMHLKRGGRISGVAATFGTALGIKPVMHVDDEGKLVPVRKVRGRKNSLQELIDQMGKDGVNLESQTIFICHGDCEQDAKFLEEEIKNRFNVKQVIINYIGPAIGAHAGPDTIAVFFFGEQRGG